MKLVEYAQCAAKRILQEVGVFKRVLNHPRTPRVSKVLLGAALAYAASPIDLIPDFIPVIGHLDDAVVLSLLVWLAFRWIPRGVVDECRQEAAKASTGPAGPGNSGRGGEPEA
jgi:uncharacterized membrane protein YkvA (DUF1232 family)